MSVLLPNAQLRVKVLAHAFTRDAYGTPVAPNPATATVRGPYPGALRRQTDLTWHARLDTRLWPVRPGDVIVDETDRTFVISTADLHEVPGCSDADHIAVTCTLDPPEVP